MHMDLELSPPSNNVAHENEVSSSFSFKLRVDMIFKGQDQYNIKAPLSSEDKYCQSLQINKPN